MLEPAGQSGPRTPPVTPQLALRVAILGGIAFALFAIVFLRLWFMQVLTGDRYRQDALDNRVRTVAISAPRGSIRDREGHAIVENRVATVVQLDPRKLPQAERDNAATWGQEMTRRSKLPKGHRGEPPAIPKPATPELKARYASLARVLGVSPRRVSQSVIQQLAVLPYANIRVKVDVPQSMRNYLLEHQQQLPRHRRAAGLPAPLSARDDRCADPRHDGRDQPEGDRDQGLPRSAGRHDRRPGRDRALLRPLPARQRGRPEHHGRRRRPSEGPADRARAAGGARAAHDARPAAAANRAAPAQRRHRRRDRDGGRGRRDRPAQRPGARHELLPDLQPVGARAADHASRATTRSSARAPARRSSTARSRAPTRPARPSRRSPRSRRFERGVITADTPIDDPGFLKVGPQTFKNAGGAVNGTLSLRRALQVSSDVFFYTLGRDINGLQGQVIQTLGAQARLRQADRHRHPR